MKRIYLLLLLFAAFISAFSQTSKEELFATPEKTAGVYYAYPAKEIIPYTTPPKGYEPFYISHFGRHGSRYLISDSDYKDVLDRFEDAYNNNALTDLGKDVYVRLQQVWQEAELRGGDLSPLGIREHKGIAERMYITNPQVFSKDGKYTACATTIVRCVLSMDAFCERLKELNPSIQIERNSGMKWQSFLNHHTKEAIEFRSAKYTWREQHRKFQQEHVKPARLINSLFSDKAYINKNINPEETMWQLFYIAGGMQNIETDLSFYDIFEKQELFDLWQCKNYKLYVNDANGAINGGLMFENCKPLLKDILENASRIISTNGKGADLRFAHDGNIIPLAMLLHLDGCYNSVSNADEYYKAWSDFKVAPMAGNIQIIFYRKPKSDDILVKFLLHEKEILVPPIKTDMAPFYNWIDVKNYYESLLK
ncbi:histidine-type phosphatase [Dysgonomonas sp. GY75]|uniref:histidine-type phosphatase n=1 Tax=Dysgonomonas sp. GY75 TaxID=2780419 RepID=UPI001884182D|nr:histidine-type phosphatase [Dysgonomonas sp. GY75]MBF0649877.1 histidine-type phosphatase [Dysgonomonas sp. GY75]